MSLLSGLIKSDLRRQHANQLARAAVSVTQGILCYDLGGFMGNSTLLKTIQMFLHVLGNLLYCRHELHCYRPFSKAYYI